MRAKINVAIVQKGDGHLVLKIFNGYGDPEVPFVADAVQIDDAVHGSKHTFGPECPCGPKVEGSVVKHR